MAHKKGQGSSQNGRDSCGKRLGVKCSGGQDVLAGSIIVRQRGTKFFPGVNTGLGRDGSIYSRIRGKVNFQNKSGRKIISVFGDN